VRKEALEWNTVVREGMERKVVGMGFGGNVKWSDYRGGRGFSLGGEGDWGCLQ
jgi:hypothetical protein